MSRPFDYRIIRMIRRHFAFPPVIILLLALSACSGDEELTLPPRRALPDGPQYAVTEPAYTRLHESPEIESGVVGHMRRGDIAEILRESEFTDIHGNRTSRWYEVYAEGGSGWIFGDYISLHETYAQAERVSLRLIELQHGEESFQ